MDHNFKKYQYPYYVNESDRNNHKDNYPNSYRDNQRSYMPYQPYQPNRYMPYPDRSFYSNHRDDTIRLGDYGPNPLVVDINHATKQNDNFRLALWTGEHLQLTLMSIEPGEDIGLELHPDVDQFLRVEEGEGIVMMGDRRDHLDFQAKVYDDFAFIIPAGKWHNVYNTGDIPLKLYSIYAPVQHPHGTVHETKEDAEAGEE